MVPNPSHANNLLDFQWFGLDGVKSAQKTSYIKHIKDKFGEICA